MALNPPSDDQPDHQSDPHGGAAVPPLPQATAALASQPTQPPTGFIDSVMFHVRSQPRPRRHLPLPAGRPGKLSITEHAAATLLSAAADTITGAISLRCHFPHPGNPTHLHLSISLAYGLHAHTTADHIRTAIHTAAHTQLGLQPHRIDITIDDIHPPGRRDAHPAADSGPAGAR